MGKRRIGYTKDGKRCKHEKYDLIYVQTVTMQPKERRCVECGHRQKAKLVWEDIPSVLEEHDFEASGSLLSRFFARAGQIWDQAKIRR